MGFISCSRRILIAALLLCGVTTQAAITRTQNVSVNGTSATLTSCTAGDLILVWAYNTASVTIPTIASGWTTISSAGANATAYNVGWKIATGGEVSTGTWTNATQICSLVYRGTSATPIGAFTPTNATGTTLTYGALTFQVTDGTSWAAAFGGGKAMTAGMSGSPASGGLGNRANVTTANALDTNTGVTTLASGTLAVTTGGPWYTITIEVKAVPSAPVAKTGFLSFFNP